MIISGCLCVAVSTNGEQYVDDQEYFVDDPEQQEPFEQRNIAWDYPCYLNIGTKVPFEWLL